MVPRMCPTRNQREEAWNATRKRTSSNSQTRFPRLVKNLCNFRQVHCKRVAPVVMLPSRQLQAGSQYTSPTFRGPASPGLLRCALEHVGWQLDAGDCVDAVAEDSPPGGPAPRSGPTRKGLGVPIGSSSGSHSNRVRVPWMALAIDAESMASTGTRNIVEWALSLRAWASDLLQAVWVRAALANDGRYSKVPVHIALVHSARHT